MKWNVLRAIGAVAAWGALHSLTATPAAKRLAVRRAGKRNEQGLYRLAYNGVAVLSTAALLLYLRRLPDRTLYRVRGPARVPVSALRVAMLLIALRGAVEIGIGPFSGVSEAWVWLRGGRTFPAPEAQGPSLDAESLQACELDRRRPGQEDRFDSTSKPLRTGGPFRYVRHPLNASASALFFLTPEMTEVRLTLAMVILMYALIGSKLEEGRLSAMYGEAYREYRNRVPFFLPRLGSSVPRLDLSGPRLRSDAPSPANS